MDQVKQSIVVNGSSSLEFSGSLTREVISVGSTQSQSLVINGSSSFEFKSLTQEVLSCRSRILRQFDPNNLFAIAKNVLLNQIDATANSTTPPFDATVAEAIRKLSCKMSCNCSGETVIDTVKEIVQGNNYLSKFDLDARMVISVAAFALNYGQFRLLVESCYQKNQVMMNLAVLKQLQFGAESNLKLVDGINILMKSVLQMIDLSLELIQNQKKINATSSRVDLCLAQAACVTIYALVSCSSFITAPAGFGFNLQGILSNLLELGNGPVRAAIQSLQLEVDKTSQDHDDWNKLRDIFSNFNVPSIEEILNALIKTPTAVEKATLVFGSKISQEGSSISQEVRFDQVKGKNVYLLITGAYTTENEIKVLAEFVKKQKDQYQLIWIPISIAEGRFDAMQALMNWYTVRHPTLIRTGAIRFIKETCQFQEQTVLVPLCQKQLEFYSIDWLWSRCTFPGISDSPPPQLPQSLSFNYLLSDIYQLKISEKTSSPPIICLYGGEDLAWIQSFTKLLGDARQRALGFNINMEFIYVSKSDGIDTANQEIFNVVNQTKLGTSTAWKSEGTECWRFWIRVESFFSEQMRVGISTKADIMKQAITLLSYNTNEKGWAVFGEYTSTDTCVKLAQATGSVAATVLKSIQRLRFNDGATLVKTLGDEFDKCVKQQPHHCSHIMLPARIGDFDDKITCPICEKTMSNYRFYRCCV